MKSVSKPIAANNRTKVGNGTALFAEGDGRSAWGRRYREIVAAHISDFASSPEALSEAKRSLVKRVATLEIELEKLEGRLSQGEEINLDLYSRVSGQLRRMLETLGPDRVAKDVTPSIVDILARHASKDKQ
jgi:hypothetical protein